MSVSDRANGLPGFFNLFLKVIYMQPDKKPKPLTEAQRKKLFKVAMCISDAFPSDEDEFWQYMKGLVTNATEASEEVVLGKVASYRQLLKTVIAEAEA